MSDTFQEAIEIAYDKGWNDSYGSFGQESKSDKLARLIKNYPCESAAQKLLRACKAITNALADWMEIADQEDERESDYQALKMARAAIAEADPSNADPINPEMDALMEIYMFGTNPVSEQGCIDDVDFLCLISKMRQIAKKVIEKSEENKNVE